MNSKLKPFNFAFRKGDFKAALNGYIRLLEDKLLFEYLSSTLEVNIHLSEKRLYKVSDTSSINLQDVIQFVDNEINHDCELNKLDHHPLVSIIVTTYNDEINIYHSIVSLLQQSYPNLEIIVVDDNSQDNTAQVIDELIRANNNLKYIRLTENLGTYFAKNVGIQASRGEYLFFQDSDDFSHENRILFCIKKMLFHNSKVVNCEYARYKNEKIIKINNYISKLGLITLGIHRDIINEIGYFNCTIKASDDEFFNRIVLCYGRNGVLDVDYPLYYVNIRENSLSADMGRTISNNNMVQTNTAERQEYVNNYKKIHKKLDVSQFKDFFNFPRIRDAIKVNCNFSLLANPSLKVVLGLYLFNLQCEQIDYLIQYYNCQCDYLVVFTDEEYVENLINHDDIKVQVVLQKDKKVLENTINNLVISLYNLYGNCIWIPIVAENFYKAEYVNKILKQNLIKAKEIPREKLFNYPCIIE